MIQFDNLSLSYDNKNLYISASIIEDDDNFDVFLDQIIIDDIQSYDISGPSNNPTYTKTCEKPKVYNELGEVKNDLGQQVYIEGPKKIVYIIPAKNFRRSVDNNILFVYITSKSSNPEKKTEIVLKAIYNNVSLLNKIACKLPNFNVTCDIPKAFYNFILNKEALDINLKVGNFKKCIFYFKQIIKNINKTKKCNCDGQTYFR